MSSSANSAVTSNRDRIFELVAGHPALDLINTLDWRFRATGPEELLDTYPNLLRFGQQSGLWTAARSRHFLHTATGNTAAQVLAGVQELRDASADVFYAVIDDKTPPAASMRTLETCFKSARNCQSILWSGTRVMWDWPQRSAFPHLPLWILSTVAEKLMSSAEIQNVRACDNPDCRWLFLDTSKNHTRRWCDMKICGNRMKARRFKAVHRA